MVKYWIKNISGKIEAVFFKLGTRNVHHKTNKMTSIVLLPWKLIGSSFFLSKTKYPHFQPFKSATEGPWGDIHVKEWCQLSRRILLVIMICISYFQGLEISFPKITQVVKFQQKNPAHQLPVNAQGLHLNHKGLRELKKLWRTSGCPLLAAALGINRFV